MSAKAPRPPAYQRHRATGQAKVRINGRDHYLGIHGSVESKDRYADLIHKWRLRIGGDDRYMLTVDDLSLAYFEHVQKHYVKDGRPTSEQCCIRAALRFLIKLAGRNRARDFGPKLLKAVRQKMIDAGLARTTINMNTGRVRRMFRWALAEELVPASVITALEAVQGLQAGRCDAVETEPVRPVHQAAIDAIEPYVSRPVWGAVRVQLLTGMRSGELLRMRGCDINMSGAVWEYRPASHKTQHHGKDRVVFIGPQAQRVIAPFLKTDLQAFLFDPRDARRSSGRDGKVYKRDAYRRAIQRGCEHAFGMPVELMSPRRPLAKLPPHEREAELNHRAKAAAWRAEHCWFPHQLRHSAATFFSS